MKLGLLLTGTIDPGSTPFVAFTGVDQRIASYRHALATWLRVPGIDVVTFCENSGFGTDPLKATAGNDQRCEVLSFDGNHGAQSKGKGRGEFAIMEHALDHTPSLEACDVILKVTGRLTIRNAATLVRLLRADTSGAAVWTDLRAHLSAAESRCLFASPTFLRTRLLPRAEEVNDHAGTYFEHVFARSIHAAMAEGDIWRPLPAAPRIVGRSGSNGQHYARGPMQGAWTARAWMERRLHRGFGPGG